MRNTIITQNNSEVIVNGRKIPLPNGVSNNVTIINNKVYVNGYGYVNGRWKRTLKALWHKFF